VEIREERVLPIFVQILTFKDIGAPIG